MIQGWIWDQFGKGARGDCETVESVETSRMDPIQRAHAATMILTSPSFESVIYSIIVHQ